MFSAGIVVVLLASSLAAVTGGTVLSQVPADITLIVRAYYPDLATGNRILMSFESETSKANYEAGYHVMRVTQDKIAQLEALGLRAAR